MYGYNDDYICISKINNKYIIGNNDYVCKNDIKIIIYKKQTALFNSVTHYFLRYAKNNPDFPNDSKKCLSLGNTCKDTSWKPLTDSILTAMIGKKIAKPLLKYKSNTKIAKVEPTVKSKKKTRAKIRLKIKKNNTNKDSKSALETKVLAALKQENINKAKCIVVEKSNLLTGVKANFCIKKSDILKLGEYKKFENFPKNMIATIKGCKSNSCIRKAAGKNVYKLFVQKKERYHTKHPGDIIYGMAWFEILYLDKLKKAQSTINRYSVNRYEGLMKLKKREDEKKIYSLIKMNNGRIKMRNALGLSLYDDLELVLKNHWLLGDFLNNDVLKVEKVALDPELKKRKLLLDKYKTTLSKYKKKLEEKKDNS